jgi:carbonic anhydrase
MTCDSQSPVQALDVLLAGNRRFVGGAARHPNQDAARRAELAQGQEPFVVLPGRSDSRLAAEIILDQGLGDLLVARTAGHVPGPEVLGSIEYGTSVLECRLVVVLEHDSCGAVATARGAIEDGPSAPGYVVKSVTPSVLAARAAGLYSETDLIDSHIGHTVDLLLDRSRVLADQVARGPGAVVGQAYRLAEGNVRLVTTRGIPAAESAGASVADR